MQTFKLVWILVIASVLLGCSGGDESTSGDQGGAGRSTAPTETLLTKALAEAKESGRNVVFEYYDPLCATCVNMDRSVIRDEEVQEALGQVVYVRMTKNDDADSFEERWGTPGTPSFVVTTPSGSQVGKIVTGSIEAGDFLMLIDWAASGEGDQPEFKTGSS